jgi:arginyl-tRNA synthetase
MKEKQILLLENELTQLSKQRDQLKPSPELAKLLNENQKLKYRIKILEQSLEQEKLSQTKATSLSTQNMPTDSVKLRQLTSKPQPANEDRNKYSLSVTDMLYSLFDIAIQKEFSDLPDAAVLITNSKVADYQCNSAMSIANV